MDHEGFHISAATVADGSRSLRPLDVACFGKAGHGQGATEKHRRRVVFQTHFQGSVVEQPLQSTRHCTAHQRVNSLWSCH